MCRMHSNLPSPPKTQKALERALWGDVALQPKTKRLVRIKPNDVGKLTPLFAQLVLEPIWRAYTVYEPGADVPGILGKMADTLHLKEGPGGPALQRAIAQGDPRGALRAVMRAWLPLDRAVLGMAVECLPSPRAAAPDRMMELMGDDASSVGGGDVSQHVVGDGSVVDGGMVGGNALQGVSGVGGVAGEQVQRGIQAQRAAMMACDVGDDAPVVVFVSKMIAVPAAALPRYGVCIVYIWGVGVWLGVLCWCLVGCFVLVFGWVFVRVLCRCLYMVGIPMPPVLLPSLFTCKALEEIKPSTHTHPPTAQGCINPCPPHWGGFFGFWSCVCWYVARQHPSTCVVCSIPTYE